MYRIHMPNLSTYKSSDLLKKLIKENKKKYQCEICNLTI